MTRPGHSPGSQPNDPLRELADRLRDALQLFTKVADGRVEIALPDDGTILFVGAAPRPNGTIRLYIGAALPSDAPHLAPLLSRAFGGGAVVRGGGGKELRQQSPYGPADMARVPDEATDWFVGRITAARDAAEHQDVRVAQVKAVYSPANAPIPGDEALRRRVIALVAETMQLRSALVQRRDSNLSDEQLNQLAEQQAEIAALRTDRDEIRLLLGEADGETSELKIALGDARDLEEMATRIAGEAEAELERVVAQLNDLKQQATAEPASGLSSQGLADGIVEILGLVPRDTMAHSSTTTLFERAHAMVQGDQRVATMLSEQYLRVGRPGDAIGILGSVSARSGSPASAAVLAEAYLQLRQPPPDEVIDRADWAFSKAASLLPGAVEWLSADEALRMADALVRNPPTTVDPWFSALTSLVPDTKLERLHAAWIRHDVDSAAHAVLQWTSEARVPLAAEWVVAALRLATGSEDHSDASQSFKYLLEAASRTGDRDLLTFVSTEGPRRLVGREWLDLGMQIAHAASQLRGNMPPTEQEAMFVVDLYWPARAEGDNSILRGLRTLAERMHRQAEPALRPLLDPILRDRDIQEGAPGAQAVATVFEALENVAIRHHGLIVMEDARESARQRGVRGVKKALHSLEALGAVADGFAAGTLDPSVLEAACRQLPGYKEDVSDAAKQQYPKSYKRTLPDGRAIVLGPHIDGGGRDGRIYFYIDRDLKRIIVGHVGLHLPGQRDG